MQVAWQRTPLVEPLKNTIRNSIKRLVNEERGRLGEVLLNFAEAAQTQINAKRKELMNPIND